MVVYRQGFTNMMPVIWFVTMLFAMPDSFAARAADAVLDEATDLSGAAMFMESHALGMVLVAVRGDDQIIPGFGETTSGNGQEPNGSSLSG
jgi:D-alanyl-D-alanine-carboxypeptidase/D-alanyl-D-alanine-endopeptidase